ncbi:hypothetical protein ANCCAN_19983 [Ancylostoma caninum]|uniref:Uncharacterized protein n=1 Tax=Ancylostoma caninum TaxID=29170 RepID=A0A368FPU5_ANCCA|nr:hypothetical protein ANCCAN_19983 [Ancylostoma caninum]
MYRIKELNGHAEDFPLADNASSSTSSFVTNSTAKKDARSSGKKATGDSQTNPAKRIRKTKPREVAPDAELGYNNGCIVDEYKGFSTKYTEPVVLVSYKEPLPKGFEDKQDEIVPVRIIAEKDPKKYLSIVQFKSVINLV